MELDSDSLWSETSDDEGGQDNPPLQSRAYQIEMFEHSLKSNIVAVMGTGSGKTQVSYSIIQGHVLIYYYLSAKLRIEAELERSADKRVWFTAPSVVLAYQQYRFLSQQLPAFQFRLITGMDNAEHWKSREIWDKVLHNIHVVVSTPAILLEALDYGFMFLTDISLLVFDEAHHCVGKSSLNMIMQHHYHPFFKSVTDRSLPCILGLSASPITKKSTSEVTELEANLNSKCKSPSQQLEEYTAFVNMPRLETLSFGPNQHLFSNLLTDLRAIVAGLRIDDDPIMRSLRDSDDMRARDKLEKFIKKNCTPAMKELQSLLRSSQDIHENLGTWACDMFIKNCVQKADAVAQMLPYNDRRFINSSLHPLRRNLRSIDLDISARGGLSPKVEVLLDFLAREYRSNLRGLIFVKARHTAWLLTEVINTHPSIRDYNAFSFVGVSNPSHQGAFDFAVLSDQHENLERFRRGEHNLCVATSVLEEGIDVPAVNLVLCFDERPNFRSFVQSRGRARHQDSKFILFHDSATKVKLWQSLEDDMKEECERLRQDLEERERIEEMDESDCEVFRVESTGATLTFYNARQRLQRFCATLPQKDEFERTTPTFCIDGDVGVNVSAKVYLPTSLPPHLQVARSKASWLTEKTAKRDAAFQAYLALYRAGLVTENLLPPEWPKENDDAQHDELLEKRDSICAVEREYPTWPSIVELWRTTDIVYAHQLQIEGDNCRYPKMIILLPTKLSKFGFPLVSTDSSGLQVTLEMGREVQGFPVDLAREVSFHLLVTVLGRRLKDIQKNQVPFLLIPDMQVEGLKDWYGEVATSAPMIDLISNGVLDGREYLVRSGNHQVPYVYQRAAFNENGTVESQQRLEADRKSTELLQICARKLSRRLDYLTLAHVHAPDDSRVLSIEECAVLGLPVDYARLILLVPSITHMLEVALRTTQACNGPLSTLGFDNIDLVSEALTLPRVNSRNYQRLEFLGDDLLKFYSSIQVFADYPSHPESQLTLYRNRIINNARLQRATRSLGLDQYLTQHRFAGSGWAAGVTGASTPVQSPTKSHLSSKVLADVIEALLGAASLTGIDDVDSEAKVIAALKLFIYEVPWRSVSENVEHSHGTDSTAVDRLDWVAPVESMIGYSFQDRSLLAQALTQSSLGGAISSYNRLEFLGDALLDRIVKLRLFRSPLQFDPEQMTIRRHALVSHATLAFFALQTSHVTRTFEVQTDPFSKKTVDKEVAKTIYLPNYIKHIGSQQVPLDRNATLAYYHEVQPTIIESFEKGCKFPWAQLLHLKVPKAYSDIVESILAAVFVDSKGNLSACTSVLDRMGYMNLVDRLATEKDIDTRHPEQILCEVLPGSELFAQEKTRGGWRCKVMVDGERIAHAKNASCREEAQCRAAEKALEALSRRRQRENVSRVEFLKQGSSEIMEE